MCSGFRTTIFFMGKGEVRSLNTINMGGIYMTITGFFLNATRLTVVTFGA